MQLFETIESIGKVIDLIGVIILVFGLILSTFIFIAEWLRHTPTDSAYKDYRQNLGRSILLGLEFLVAGDIIRSVAGTPSFVSVGVLGLIVIIRSFLSVTFEMEIDGRWPWKRK